ncbi:MAG: radical SAM protein [bacterium]|nr:radical SAM protein [bacterium]
MKPGIDVEKKVRLLRERVGEAISLLGTCSICPRNCGVNRLEGETGVCRVGREVIVSTASLHHGEEPPISGYCGSGTIFFSSCNLRCVFCQNYEISQMSHGDPVTTDELAAMMLALQKKGAHNINLVTPTHFGPQIMEALLKAYERGLSIPIVYNCGGYDSVEVLKLWDGIIDIYMPDMKYGKEESARKYSSAPDYPRANQEAVLEMHRQVGDLRMDEQGIAKRGLLIRHLVLPNGVAGSEEVMRFIAEKVSRGTYISLMSQYFPQYRADEFPEINRRITRAEYLPVQNLMKKLGLTSGWFQNVPIDPEVFALRRFLLGDTDK